jgi:predicted ABC-type ATPase
LVVIAGHNGAGKTTFYRERLEGSIASFLVDYINPDDIERAVATDLGESRPSKDELEKIAAAEATRRRLQHLERDNSFSFETGFSDQVLDKVAFIESARQRGYLVVLMAVGLMSIEKCKERVAIRHAGGGHDIRADKLERRYDRVLRNFAHGARSASLAIYLDNSEDRVEGGEDTYWDIAFFEDGLLVCKDESPPRWWLEVERMQSEA